MTYYTGIEGFTNPINFIKIYKRTWKLLKFVPSCTAESSRDRHKSNTNHIKK